MKNLRFERIYLLSHRDKKALQVNFNSKRNLIMGENHTGKSSLVKSIFTTLGATPKGRLENWDPQTVTALDFNVDGKIYRAVHQEGRRALFSDNQLIFSAASHADWSEKFAEIIGFNLIVTVGKTRLGAKADPACLFLPFYIDQDGSWRDSWDTFPSTRRFAKPVTDILEYFSGIRPAEYYSLKSELNSYSKAADGQVSELRLLERAQKRLNQALPKSNVSLSERGFEEEVKRLTHEANLLNESQERLKIKSVREAEIVSSIEQQIKNSYASLKAYSGDKTYLAKLEGAQDLICPTCGAEHEHSFLSYLGYAEDARILEELCLSLKEDLLLAKKEQEKTSVELSYLRENYSRINDILQTKRGVLKFKEVVESHGADAARQAFDSERESIASELAESNTKIQTVSTRLKELTDRKRTKIIQDEFRKAYANSRSKLNVPDPTGKITILSRPNRSGSGGPRLLLAYYAAIWQICSSAQSNISIPVVIDSPNQQDQDNLNLHAVLDFIADSLPKTMQLIVCVTQQSTTQLDQTIILNRKYSLLDASSYDDVEAEIGPVFRKMNTSLLNLSD